MSRKKKFPKKKFLKRKSLRRKLLRRRYPERMFLQTKRQRNRHLRSHPSGQINCLWL